MSASWGERKAVGSMRTQRPGGSRVGERGAQKVSRELVRVKKKNQESSLSGGGGQEYAAQCVEHSWGRRASPRASGE